MSSDPFEGLDAVDPGHDPFKGLDEPPPLPPIRVKTSGSEALARGAGAGASMGLGDEAAGMGAWLAGKVHPIARAAGRGVDAPLARINPGVADYVTARDQERDANKQAAADTAFDKEGMNPMFAAATPDSMFGVGEAAGTIATAAAPIGGVAGKGATLAARAAPAAKAGAALGAVSGFGAGEGGAGEQLASTATGAALGAVAGPIAAEVSRLGVHGAGAARKYLGKTADRVLTGGPAAREVAYGSPELARKAEHLADPLAGKAARAEATAGADPAVIATHERASAGKLKEIEQLSSAASTDPEALAAADRLASGPEARSAAYGSHERAGMAEMLADPGSADGRRMRALADLGADPAVQDRHAQEIARRATDLWDHGDVVKWHEDIASKKPVVRAAMHREGLDPRSVTTAADAAIAETAAMLDDMGGYVEKGTNDRTLINKLQREIREYSLKQPGGDDADATRFAQQYHGQAHGDADYDVAADRFMRLDQVKREFQKALDNASKQRGSAIIDQLRGVEEKLRTHLEDPQVWGQGASAFQQVRNRGWRERLLLEGKDAAPDRMFLSDASGQSGIDPYRIKLIGDQGKIAGIVRGAGKIENQKGEQSLLRWADREAGLLEALTQHTEADPDLLQRAARARQLATEIRELLGRRANEASAAAAVEAVGAATPALRSPAELGNRIKPTDMRARVTALQNAERAGVSAPQGGPVELGPPGAAPAAPIGRADFRRASASEAEKYAQQELSALRLIYGPDHPNAQKAAAALRELQQGYDRRATEAAGARDMDRVVAVKPPPPGGLQKSIEGQPFVGPIAKAIGERVRGQPLGDRAQMLAKLEDVLSKNPDNPFARKLLKGMTPQERPVRKGMAGRALNAQPATRGARLAGLQSGATVADRMHAMAQQDPEQLGEDGKLLAQAKDKADFSVKHAALLATSQEYREKAREMAKQAELEPDPDPDAIE